jgi:gliding motility-associated lipoprotein GldH
MKNSIWLFFIVFIIISCDKKQVYDSYVNLDGIWKKNNKVSFQIDQKDVATTNNLFIQVRNNNDYPYNNLFLIVKQFQPNKKVLVDTLEYEMTDKEGKLLGTGFSDVKESKLVYKENFSFPLPGKYTIQIEQAVRQTGKVDAVKDLPGVMDVGLRIEKR